MCTFSARLRVVLNAEWLWCRMSCLNKLKLTAEVGSGFHVLLNVSGWTFATRLGPGNPTFLEAIYGAVCKRLEAALLSPERNIIALTVYLAPININY